MPITSSWTPREDDALRALIEEHGAKKWSLVSSLLGTKGSKQCRRRWKNFLNADLKKGGWSKEEDQVLLEGHRVHGNRWTEIAKMVGGRTDNAVKNRWAALCKRTDNKMPRMVRVGPAGRGSRGGGTAGPGRGRGSGAGAPARASGRGRGRGSGGWMVDDDESEEEDDEKEEDEEEEVSASGSESADDMRHHGQHRNGGGGAGRGRRNGPPPPLSIPPPVGGLPLDGSNGSSGSHHSAGGGSPSRQSPTFTAAVGLARSVLASTGAFFQPLSRLNPFYSASQGPSPQGAGHQPSHVQLHADPVVHPGSGNGSMSQAQLQQQQQQRVAVPTQHPLLQQQRWQAQAVLDLSPDDPQQEHSSRGSSGGHGMLAGQKRRQGGPLMNLGALPPPAPVSQGLGGGSPGDCASGRGSARSRTSGGGGVLGDEGGSPPSAKRQALGQRGVQAAAGMECSPPRRSPRMHAQPQGPAPWGGHRRSSGGGGLPISRRLSEGGSLPPGGLLAALAAQSAVAQQQQQQQQQPYAGTSSGGADSPGLSQNGSFSPGTMAKKPFGHLSISIPHGPEADPVPPPAQSLANYRIQVHRERLTPADQRRAQEINAMDLPVQIHISDDPPLTSCRRELQQTMFALLSPDGAPLRGPGAAAVCDAAVMPDSPGLSPGWMEDLLYTDRFPRLHSPSGGVIGAGPSASSSPSGRLTTRSMLRNNGSCRAEREEKAAAAAAAATAALLAGRAGRDPGPSGAAAAASSVAQHVTPTGASLSPSAASLLSSLSRHAGTLQDGHKQLLSRLLTGARATEEGLTTSRAGRTPDGRACPSGAGTPASPLKPTSTSGGAAGSNPIKCEPAAASHNAKTEAVAGQLLEALQQQQQGGVPDSPGGFMPVDVLMTPHMSADEISSVLELLDSPRLDVRA